MAIAGVDSVRLLTVLGKPKVWRGETIRPLLYADPNGEYYTPEQMRDILIKFANFRNAMRRDMTVEQIVDDFMERGE